MTDTAARAVERDDQLATIAFLERPESYGTGAGPVVRIDTHVSTIFLIGERAYKLKRAVRFSYLDFSTVPLREASARAELRLNARTAPDIYLGVRSIARDADGSLAFDGAGDVVDWVVEMTRFDEAAVFDRMSDRGALDDALATKLAIAIATFHQSAERTPEIGGRASIEIEIDGNESNLALVPPALFPAATRVELVRRWRIELERHGALLDARAVAGKVRRCHGDLHLRNIVLWHGRPTLFDCIEFSDHLSCIDVLYDLAFLLMDLVHRGEHERANLIFNTYLDCGDESCGIVALPLLMSLRAAIRAHTGVAGANAQRDRTLRAAGLVEARAYLDLALHLLRDETPRLIAIGGLSGSGKTTLARALGAKIGRVPGARTIHTDAVRKRLFGVARTTRLDASAYTPAVSDRVYRSQRDATATTLREGWSTIVDGVFARPRDRAAIEETARLTGIPFVGLWLTATDDILRKRVDERRGDMSDATLAIVETQRHAETSDIEWTEIDGGGTPAETLRRARDLLARASHDLRAVSVP